MQWTWTVGGAMQDPVSSAGTLFARIDACRDWVFEDEDVAPSPSSRDSIS